MTLRPSDQAVEALKPCPWCGTIPTEIRETDGSKWGAVVCCGTGPEVRTNYQPVEHWRNEAIAAWNDRVDSPSAGAPSEERPLVERLASVLRDWRVGNQIMGAWSTEDLAAWLIARGVSYSAPAPAVSDEECDRIGRLVITELVELAKCKDTDSYWVQERNLIRAILAVAGHREGGSP